MAFPKGFFLIHDSSSREDETDICVPAELVTYEHIRIMRKYAGGLICLAIQKKDCELLGIKHMTEILRNIDCGCNVYTKTVYGDEPAFSISVNHKSARTGIIDIERAYAAKRIFELCANSQHSAFKEEFFTPGHLHLLKSRGIENRKGHTEMSIEYAKKNGYYPMVLICEMLGNAGTRLEKNNAKKFGEFHNIPFMTEMI